jgi:hypothetical protein
MQPQYRGELEMKQNKNAVLVVGMHRSGTSVLTRGLKTIGVELGDHLSSSAEDNLRGFWEDKDVLALNEKILRIIGRRWDSVRPVTLSGIKDEVFRSLRDEGKAFFACSISGLSSDACFAVPHASFQGRFYWDGRANEPGFDIRS